MTNSVKQIFDYIQGMNPSTSTISSMGTFVTNQSQQVADMVVKEVVFALSNADKKETLAYKIASTSIKFSEKQLFVIAYELENIESFSIMVVDFYTSINRKAQARRDESKEKLTANKEASADVLAPIKALKKLGDFGKWLNTPGNAYRKQHFSKKYNTESVNAFLAI